MMLLSVGIKLLNEKVFNQAINIGTGRKTTVKQIIEMIKSITKVTETETIEGTPVIN